MDYSPSGSSVHEILQARILEWVATSLLISRESQLYVIKTLKQTFERPVWQGPEAYSQQPREWAILRGDPRSQSGIEITAAPANTLTAVSLETLNQKHPDKLYQNSWPTETLK